MSVSRRGRWSAGLAPVVLLALSADGNAGVIKNWGRDLGAGAAEALEPALSRSLAEAEGRLTRAEDHLGQVGQDLLKDTNHVLEQRLLQAQLGLGKVADDAVAGVDEMLQNRLVQAKGVVTELSAQTRVLLNDADKKLHDRIDQLGDRANQAVTRADTALAARIDQLDEAAERRLGNVDVIASKQRIALEQTAVHIAVLVGFVVFIVFVVRRLWLKYQTPSEAEAGRRSPGWRMARTLGPPLLGQLALAAGIGGGILVLYDRLPAAARREAAALATTHEQGLASSMRALDFSRVRYHASQLEYLKPENSNTYRGLTAKAQLLRDLLERPTLLGTPAGVTEVWNRLAAARRLLGPRPDRDLLVVEAILLWETGDSRRDEQRAASLCARAMRPGHLPGGGFVLAPLGRVLIELYLDAPYVDPAVGVGRDAETPDDLRATLDAAPPPPALDHPYAAKLTLISLMRAADRASSTAYAQAIEQHARLVRLGTAAGNSAQATDLRRGRNQAARNVVDAWAAFDRALRQSPELARDPQVLTIFRLNDTLYSRAKWFVDRGDTNDLAPLLTPPPGSPLAAKAALPWKDRAALAPPRVAWARRYEPLMKGPAHQLLQLQEAARFADREQVARDFEQALVAGRNVDAALYAARLGLFTGGASTGAPRVALAHQLLPDGVPKPVAEALALRGAPLF